MSVDILILRIPLVPGEVGGGSFRGKKPNKPKKEFAYIECVQGHQPLGCPNRVFCMHQVSAIRLVVVFWWWLVVFPWCEECGGVLVVT